jgi:hypothetical protein
MVWEPGKAAHECTPHMDDDIINDISHAIGTHAPTIGHTRMSGQSPGRTHSSHRPMVTVTPPGCRRVRVTHIPPNAVDIQGLISAVDHHLT